MMFQGKNIIMSHKAGQQWGSVNKSRLARLKRKITRKWKEFQQSRVSQKTKKILKIIPIINPNNEGKLIWDIFMAFIRFYLLFVIPYETAFNTKLLYNQLLWSLYVCTGLLIFDILLNFITSYYDKGVLVNNHFKVAIKYIQTGFIFDAFCIITILLVLSQELSENTAYIDYENQQLRKYQYARSVISILGIIIQLQNIIRVFQKLQESQDYSETTSLLIDLLKLIMFLFLLEHLFSCIWYFIGIQEVAENSWIKQLKLSDATYTEQYITAFYFASVTMFTVGYGDVVPQNMYERLVTIGFMICSTLQLSYTISAIWNVYSKLNERSDEHIRKMRAINTYMNNVKISTQLKYEVREYLTYYWKEQKIEENLEVQDIVGQLSQDLQQNLIFEANSIIIKGCKLFNDYFSHEFKAECLKHVQTITLTPYKLIQFEQPTIYFIERGSVGVYFENNRLKLATLKTEENFCMREFILDKTPHLKYVSSAFTKLVFITKKDFLKVIQQFPEDLEQYCSLKERMIYEQNKLGFDCYSCHSMQHSIEQCPLITFIPNKDVVIKKYQFPQQQQRQQFSQRHKLKKRKQIFNEIVYVEGSEKPIQGLPTITIESDISSSDRFINVNDPMKISHQSYFQQKLEYQQNKESFRYLGLRMKSIKQKIDKQNIQQNQEPLEINIGDTQEEDLIRESDQQLLEVMKFIMKPKVSLDIDELKNYKYYFPDCNSNNISKITKINQRFFEHFNKMCFYLTYPFEFIRQYRGDIVKESQCAIQPKTLEPRSRKRITVLYKQAQPK